MSFYFPNVDPTFIRARQGTEEDPFLFLVDANHIRSGAFILKEIPSFVDGFKVTSSDGEVLNEIPVDDTKIEIDINEYRVDYTTGVVYFNLSRNGELVTCEYHGTGSVSISASRVWRIGEEGDPLESLQDALEQVAEGVETLEQVGHLEFVDEYSETHQYRKWNFVTYNNKTYVAVQDTVGNEPVNTTYWKLVSSGVGFAGVYNQGSVYNIGDIVTDTQRKNMYVSKINNNVSPLTNAEHWDLILTLDDTVQNLVNTIDQKINELLDLKDQLLQKDSERDQSEIDRDGRVDAAIADMDEFKSSFEEAETSRLANEATRQTNEDGRISQEDARQAKELERVAAEENRNDQEVARQENVSTAIGEINAAISESEDTLTLINESMLDINGLKDQAQTVVDNAETITNELTGFVHVDEYNPSTTYSKYNIVTFDGSSYMAVRETQGNSIEDTHYWRLMAQGGRDGLAITVNGIEANMDGNIDLGELEFAKEEDIQAVKQEVQDEFNLKIGDPQVLATVRKDSLVSAINELKRRIDDVIDVIS